jgi:hypothetical protein
VGDKPHGHQSALCIRAPRPDDGFGDRALELHDVPDALAAAVRRAVRVWGEYRNFRELTDGRNPDYYARYTPFDYSYAANGNPDFSVKSFRTTNVLRWEYRPGSTLFVVWQQARENDFSAGAFRFGRDARAIFGVPPHNVFLIKLAYWLNV